MGGATQRECWPANGTRGTGIHRSRKETDPKDNFLWAIKVPKKKEEEKIYIFQPPQIRATHWSSSPKSRVSDSEMDTLWKIILSTLWLETLRWNSGKATEFKSDSNFLIFLKDQHSRTVFLNGTLVNNDICPENVSPDQPLHIRSWSKMERSAIFRPTTAY